MPFATSLYAAFNVASGNGLAQVTERHRAIEFIGFLKKIDRERPRHLALHLIVDNSSTHKTQEVRQWLDKHPRFHLHLLPPVSMAECRGGLVCQTGA